MDIGALQFGGFNKGYDQFEGIETGPVIVTHPQSQSVFDGTLITFTIAATGTGTLSYQWKKDNVAIGNDSPTLEFIVLTTDDNAQITCTVIDSVGSTDSNAATLSLIERVLTTIQVLPSSANVRVTKTLQFTDVQRDQTGALLITPHDVVWSINVGAVSVISETGLLTAGAIVEECTVTATFGDVHGDADVTIIEALDVSTNSHNRGYGYLNRY